MARISMCWTSLLAAAALAGCGGSDDPKPEAKASPDASPASSPAADPAKASTGKFAKATGEVLELTGKRNGLRFNLPQGVDGEFDDDNPGFITVDLPPGCDAMKVKGIEYRDPGAGSIQDAVASYAEENAAERTEDQLGEDQLKGDPQGRAGFWRQWSGVVGSGEFKGDFVVTTIGGYDVGDGRYALAEFFAIFGLQGCSNEEVSEVSLRQTGMAASMEVVDE